MTVRIDPLADRPDLADAHAHLADLSPDFMLHDPTAELYFDRLDVYADHVFLATNEAGHVWRSTSNRTCGCPQRDPVDLTTKELP